MTYDPELHEAEPAEDEFGWAHADYPHEPGTLYDCAACEAGPCACQLAEDWGCVSDNCLYMSPARGPGGYMREVRAMVEMAAACGVALDLCDFSVCSQGGLLVLGTRAAEFLDNLRSNYS